jgi:hypothetical protein
MCDRRQTYKDLSGVDSKPLNGVMEPVGVKYLAPDNLTVQEIRHLAAMILNRLHGMSKNGVLKVEDVLTLPTEAFYEQNRIEVAFLKRLGDKLCRLSLAE